jgi:NAD(P)-dependent dehydrogenase (short-subunit alcohol dehydrogenase family)
MTTPHAPVRSGFTADSTAKDVLEGVDLSTTTVLVTGGYSGIGLATTQALSDAGAAVLVPARRMDVALAAVTGIPRVEVAPMDLADLDSVHRYAARLRAEQRRIDHVITMGGVMANPEQRVGPGWESQFAVNHLGHFVLLNDVWSLIPRDAGSRIVIVSSRGHKFSPMRWGDMQFAEMYDKWRAYGQSKTANVLTAVQLDVLGRGQGIRTTAAYPGGVHTPLQRHISHQEMVDLGWIDAEGNDTFPWKTPEQGAATALWGIVSPQLADIGGVYLENCEVAEIDESSMTGVNAYAVDPVQAARLWDVSARLTGTDAFA